MKLKGLDESLLREFRRTHAAVALELEFWMSCIAVAGALLALVALAWGAHSGSRVPERIVVVPMFYVAWYGLSAVLIKAGRYRPAMRYASCAIDASLGSAVLLIDLESRGPAFGVNAGAYGLYFVAIAASTLRLEPMITAFAGLLAATQLVVLSFTKVLPAVPPELASQAAIEPFVIVSRGVFLLSAAACGVVITRSLRTLVLRSAESAFERERVRSLFGVYMSEEVVEHILAGAIDEQGEQRIVTVLFSDIRNFTTLSESRSPRVVVSLLNAYFDRMCAVVARHGGVVNKFLGDGMLVVFGAPERLSDDAPRAFAAALEMQAEARRLAEEGVFPGLAIGVGLHRGPVVAGNVGGSQRQEYTVIGDTVNTASRVESLTKGLGRTVVLTSAVAEKLGEVALDPLGSHGVKGRSQELVLFAPAHLSEAPDSAAKAS